MSAADYRQPKPFDLPSPSCRKRPSPSKSESIYSCLHTPHFAGFQQNSSLDLPAGEVLLTKCCLLETSVETDGRTVVVPWGASFAELREGLDTAVRLAGG